MMMKKNEGNRLNTLIVNNLSDFYLVNYKILL